MSGLVSIEGPIARLEESPWRELYRVVIGFAFFPLLQSVGLSLPAWSLALLFGGVLLGLRLVPAILRALLPFSDTVRGRWSELRQLAKRYDSYQWQKLFWFGVGMAVSAALPGRVRRTHVILAAVCLGAGSAGLAMWRMRVAQIQKSAASASQPAGDVSSQRAQAR
jgi:hypothetical protein